MAKRGRPRLYTSGADKQRAYRERKRYENHIEYDNGEWWRAQPDGVHTLVSNDEHKETENGQQH